MGRELCVDLADLGELGFANSGLDRRDAHAPLDDAELETPVFDAEREAVSLLANTPIRMRLRAQRERRGRSLAQRQTGLRFDPRRLCGGHVVPANLEFGNRVAGSVRSREPPAARVGDRVRV